MERYLIVLSYGKEQGKTKAEKFPGFFGAGTDLPRVIPVWYRISATSSLKHEPAAAPLTLNTFKVQEIFQAH